MQDDERGPAGQAGVWRAIDASANRAGEALRVLEDMARFALGDALLTGLAKDLRHDLAGLLAEDRLARRSAVRDVAGDVGAELEAAAPLGRGSVADLVAANAARAAQALRSLEECVAVVVPALAPAFQRLRYRLYELERGGLAVARARHRLQSAGLCVLVDGQDGAAAFERLVAQLLDAGVRMLQVRDKSLPMPALADRVLRAMDLARRHAPGDPAIVIVNDRVDVAAAVAADGVHTGDDDLPTPLARRVIGPAALVGRTAHDLAAARAAVAAGADYLGVGPCFPSSTKRFDTYAPRTFLAGVATEIGLPAYAIGGVTLERLESLLEIGITRVAVGSAVTRAADPRAAAAAFVSRLAGAAG